MINPIFLVGCMRSGTTVLAKALDAHPEIQWINWEMNDIWDEQGGAPMSRGQEGKPCSFRGAGHVQAEYTERMTQYFLKELATKAAAPKVVGVGAAAKELRVDSTRVRPLNKSPHLCNKVGYIAAMFPESKIIQIIRDIHPHCHSLKLHLERVTHRDRGLIAYWPPVADHPCWQFFKTSNISSLDQSRIYPGDGFGRIAEAWITINAYTARSLEQLPKERRLVVVYENLVRHPRAEIERIHRFLGLEPYLEGIGDGFLNDSMSLLYAQTSNPMEAWRAGFSSEELSAIERVSVQFKDQVQFIQEWSQREGGSGPR